MGMDPATAAIVWPMVISAVGGVAKGISTPQGQKLQSFEGGPNDPNQTLTEARRMLEGVFSGVLARSQQPVDMSDAYVQDLPSFTGGPLPQPIGVTGSWQGGGGPGARTGTSSFDSSAMGGGAQITPFKFQIPDTSPADNRPHANSQEGVDAANDPAAPKAIPRPQPGTSLTSGLDRALGNFAPEGPDPGLGSLSAGNGTGPVRRSPDLGESAGMPHGSFGAGDVAGAGGTDENGLPRNDSTKAIGAVSLLLKLAQGGGSDFAQGVSN